MLNVTVVNMGELAVVGCEGRIVHSESAYKLREAVTSQTDAQIIVLELSEVRAIGGGGLGMLAFLQRWARNTTVQFLLLFHSFQQADCRKAAPACQINCKDCYIASLEEIKALLAYANGQMREPT